MRASHGLALSPVPRAPEGPEAEGSRRAVSNMPTALRGGEAAVQAATFFRGGPGAWRRWGQRSSSAGEVGEVGVGARKREQSGSYLRFSSTAPSEGTSVILPDTSRALS